MTPQTESENTQGDIRRSNDPGRCPARAWLYQEMGQAVAGKPPDIRHQNERKRVKYDADMVASAIVRDMGVSA